MRYTIDTREKMPLVLDPQTEGEAIMQHLYIIMQTFIGEVPLYRNFGIDMKFRHMPREEFKSLFASAIAEAVYNFEPSVRIRIISFSEDENDPSHLYPKMEVILYE